MKKNLKIYIFILALFSIVMLLNGLSRPKEVSWQKTFATNDKMPFGLYVFNEEIQSLYKNRLSSTDITPYEYFAQQKHTNQKDTNSLMLFISQYISLDHNSIKSTLSYVSKGNNLFLGVENIDEYLSDKLKVSVELMQSDIPNFIQNNKKIEEFYIKIKDSANIEVLDFETSMNKKKATFVKINYKKGHIYLFSNPIIFTNYQLLYKNSSEQVEHILSAMPSEKVIWINNFLDSSTFVRYIVSMPSLKWAWYFILIGTLLFFLFNAKRKQRAIEIREPLKNESLNFIRTIGDLYFYEKNYKDIIHKKLTYYLEKIRTDYKISTETLDDRFTHLLSLKLQKDKTDIQALIKAIERNKKASVQDENELISVTKLLDKLNYGN